jgi:predicted dehydrogenase
MLNVGVIGVGALGKHHARIYANLPGVTLVGVCDVNESAGREVAERHGVPFFSDFRELAALVDAASVAVPTIGHCEVACELLSAGKSALVEKPIAVTLEEADRMIAAADETGAILQIGHLERFNPAVRAAKSVVRMPRFFEIDRLSVFTPRSLDIDVVADLMIHDLDILAWFANSPVATIHAVGVPALSPKVDIASARIEFENGCVANVTASRVSLEKIRKMRCFHAGGYVSVDYAEQKLTALGVHPPATPDGRPIIMPLPVMVQNDEPLRAQLAAFVESVTTKTAPEVDGRAGRAALEFARRVVSEIEAHAKRANLPTLFG